MGVQVAFCRSHLVEPSCDKLSQTDERVRGEGRGIVVVWGSGRNGDPVLEEHVPNTVSKGLGGLAHHHGGFPFLMEGGHGGPGGRV